VGVERWSPWASSRSDPASAATGLATATHSGEQRSKTFARKADAQRFLIEMESDKARGRWIDPRSAELPVATWAEEFLRLCRRLSPTTLEAYRRDLRKYVLPRCGAYRLGRVPPDEVENWLNDVTSPGVAPPFCRAFGGRVSPG
jgi:hypothetical protein